MEDRLSVYEVSPAMQSIDSAAADRALEELNLVQEILPEFIGDRSELDAGIELFRHVEAYAAGVRPRVVQFAYVDGWSSGYGAAFIAAFAGARLLRRSVLFISLVASRNAGASAPNRVDRSALGGETRPSIVPAGKAKMPPFKAYSVREPRDVWSTTMLLLDRLDILKAAYDIVLLGTTMSGPDPVVGALASRVDGNVLIAQSGCSTANAVERTISLLRTGTVPLIGVVLGDYNSALPARWQRR